MAIGPASLMAIRTQLSQSPDAGREIDALLENALRHANANAGKNTYLWRPEEWTRKEASRIAAIPRSTGGIFGDGRPPFWGIPVSVKDCFDLAGAPTSCGTRFYRDLHGLADQDSWLVERLRSLGAVITGKTHLHPLAYGITGENTDFGDCLQPGDPAALTGGSSSGAAASVLEGSAMAAIGTDTGGSVRVPAALCGLAGYRASLGRGDWLGGAHLAPSFDTFGWLFRDLQDGPLLGSVFGNTDATNLKLPSKFAVVNDAFFYDCEPEVIASYVRGKTELEDLGLIAEAIDVSWWSDSIEIFAPIQASEAAQIHRGHFAQFDEPIRQRLEWGSGLDNDTIAQLRRRHAAFGDAMDTLLAQHQLLLLPAAPVARLAAGADHSQTRQRLLRYTTPISLAGMPAVTIPFFHENRPSGGTQLVAALQDDARLLAVAAQIGMRRNSDQERFSS